ncbi:MAG: LiaI-LiaF-like domain-containing protein [Acidobacteriaceae bacterium]
MNCANHPDTPVAAYCQFCGKPLCAACAHKINNIVGCEPCLAARIGAATGTYGVNIDDGKGFQYTATGPLPPPASPQPGCCTEPWLAFCLGWIPGVGAMYNGQFAKALVHVFVFAILVDLSDNHGAFGIVVAAWMFYQVFDAYQTTVARRDGLPLPNPLGLNDVGQWFGVRNNSASTASVPGPINPSQPGSPEGVQQTAAYVAPPSMPAFPPDQVDMPELRRGVPTGAVVLIVIGVAFLLGNMGIFSEYWLEKSWPLLLIGIGVWLVVQRSQNPPPGGVR